MRNVILQGSIGLFIVILAFASVTVTRPERSSKSWVASYGTTVVAFRTPNDIHVAADSRMTSTANPQDYRPYCKIRKVGSTFFAFAGIAEFYPTGFNLADISAEACQGPGTVFEKARRLETLVKPPLANIVKFMYQGPRQNVRIPASYDIGVLICAVEHGIPVMAVRKFVPVFTRSRFDSIFVDRLDCPGRSVPTNGTFLAMLGHREVVRQHLADRQLFAGGVVSGIRRLVQYEIDANPQAVGPPIDILEIGKTAYRWIGRKPQCFKDDE